MDYTLKWWNWKTFANDVDNRNYDKREIWSCPIFEPVHLFRIYHFRKLGHPVTSILILPLNARSSEIRRMPYRGKKSLRISVSGGIATGSIKWRRLGRHSTLNTLSKCWFFQRFIICCNSSLKLHLAEVGRRPSRGTPLIFGSPCSPREPPRPRMDGRGTVSADFWLRFSGWNSPWIMAVILSRREKYSNRWNNLKISV